MTRRSFASAGVAALLAALLAGCGGGGGGDNGGGGGGGGDTGIIRVVVNWPTRAVGVPSAANSVRVKVNKGTSLVAEFVAARPVDGLPTVKQVTVPTGVLTVVMTAYEFASGSGTPLASLTTTATVTTGATTNVPASLDSVIDHIDISGGSTVIAGGTLQLVATARDRSGAAIPMWPGLITWDTSAHEYATVDANGLVTGVLPTGATPGPIHVLAHDTESGKTGDLLLTVRTGTLVSVTPKTITLSVGDQQTFLATVTQAPNTDVVWSVQEGAAGGTITAGGVYTAPATGRGTYHVIATSVYDNTASASAAVTVQAGGGSVTIR